MFGRELSFGFCLPFLCFNLKHFIVQVEVDNFKIMIISNALQLKQKEQN